jgi:hypothetical protein
MKDIGHKILYIPSNLMLFLANIGGIDLADLHAMKSLNRLSNFNRKQNLLR